MKKPLRLLSLLQHNRRLKKTSWVNYREFLGRLLRSIDHTESSLLLSALEKGQWDDLVLIADRIASTKYETPAEHRLCNQLAALVRKYPFPDGSVTFDPEGRAFETFLASEHRCSRVNKRFKLFDSLRSPHEEALSKARSWIRYVLGDFSLQNVYDKCNFGPGASLGIHGNATNQARKFLAPEWSVSPSAFYYAQAVLKMDVKFWELLLRRPQSPFFCLDPDEFNREFSKRARIVEHNKISFVPKTAKTKRTIAVEPLLNGYLQKGVDVFMRKRLKRVGIDLEDQTLNQGLARFGSLSDESDQYVTIDLSSASDSITTELCRNLLPPDWFDFLNSIRSKSYIIGRVKKPYEKFTTMGNGFCFPLETLIFASLCNVAYQESARKSDYSVYGDDIIVRQSVAARVLKLLGICGFKANSDKTFLSGPFRESCGADWFEGEDVRPINLDYTFDSVENIFKFCNIVRRKDAIKSIFSGDSLEYLESLVPPDLLFTRPFMGNVDTALEVPHDVFLSSPYSQWNKKLFCWSWLEIEKTSYSDFGVKRFAGYDVALMRGALMGALSSTPFAERRKTRTKIRRISYSGGFSLYLPGEKFTRGGGELLL